MCVKFLIHTYINQNDSYFCLYRQVNRIHRNIYTYLFSFSRRPYTFHGILQKNYCSCTFVYNHHYNILPTYIHRSTSIVTIRSHQKPKIAVKFFIIHNTFICSTWAVTNKFIMNFNTIAIVSFFTTTPLFSQNGHRHWKSWSLNFYSRLSFICN